MESEVFPGIKRMIENLELRGYYTWKTLRPPASLEEVDSNSKAWWLEAAVAVGCMLDAAKSCWNFFLSPNYLGIIDIQHCIHLRCITIISSMYRYMYMYWYIDIQNKMITTINSVNIHHLTYMFFLCDESF